MRDLALSPTARIAAALGLTVLIAASAHSQGANRPGSWTAKAPLPSTWTEIVAVAANEKLYAFSGGFPAKADLEGDDPTSDKGHLLKPMPLGMDHIGTAVLDGKIYIVGGFTSNRHQQVNGSVFEYNPAND